MNINPAQCRAARGLLGWSQSDLCRVAGVARATVAEWERGNRQPIPNNVLAIKAAFEKAGVRFIDDELGGVVLLRTSQDDSTGGG